MTDDDKDSDMDAVRAEAEYLRARINELKAELDANDRAAVVEDEKSVSFVADVLVGLRSTRNEALAKKYQVAFERCFMLRARVASRVAAGEPHDDLMEAFDDASEAFERVQAETSTWFKQADEAKYNAQIAAAGGVHPQRGGSVGDLFTGELVPYVTPDGRTIQTAGVMCRWCHCSTTAHDQPRVEDADNEPDDYAYTLKHTPPCQVQDWLAKLKRDGNTAEVVQEYDWLIDYLDDADNREVND